MAEVICCNKSATLTTTFALLRLLKFWRHLANLRVVEPERILLAGRAEIKKSGLVSMILIQHFL
jgi:hypothetical protein